MHYLVFHNLQKLTQVHPQQVRYKENAKLSDNNPFDYNVFTKPGESLEDSKYNYWRKKIAAAIEVNSRKTGRTDKILLPAEYFEYTLKNEISKPINQLLTDPKSYIRLGAMSIYINYLKILLRLLKSGYDEENDEDVKEQIGQQKTEISDYLESKKREKEELIENIKTEKTEKLAEIENALPPSDPSKTSGVETLHEESNDRREENLQVPSQKEDSPPALEKEDPPPSNDGVTESSINDLFNLLKTKQGETNRREEVIEPKIKNFEEKLPRGGILKNEALEIYNEYQGKLEILKNDVSHTNREETIQLYQSLQDKLQLITEILQEFTQTITDERKKSDEVNVKIREIENNLRDISNSNSDRDLATLASVKLGESNPIIKQIRDQLHTIENKVNTIEEMKNSLNRKHSFVFHMNKKISSINNQISNGNYDFEIPPVLPLDDPDEPMVKKPKLSISDAGNVPLNIDFIDSLLDKLMKMEQKKSDQKSNIETKFDEIKDVQIPLKLKIHLQNIDGFAKEFMDGINETLIISEAKQLEYLNKIDEEQRKFDQVYQVVDTFVNQTADEYSDDTEFKKADYYLDFLKTLPVDTSFVVESYVATNLLTAQGYKNSIKADTDEIKQFNSQLKRIFNDTAKKYDSQIKKIIVQVNSAYQQLKKDDVSVPSNTSTSRPSAAATGATAAATGATTSQTEDISEEIIEHDERDNDNYIPRRKYAIGFVHFKNTKTVNQKNFEITKDTTSQDVVKFLKSLINDDLLIKNNLGMNFKPEIKQTVLSTGEADNEQYQFFYAPSCTYNKSYLQFDFNSERIVNLFRLKSIVDSGKKLTIYANKIFNEKSDYFNQDNPFTDNFEDNLPLILSPRNAGIFNTFASGIGETTSLGIIDRIGRVKNAVPVIMRPSRKERFSIDILRTDLTNKYPNRDYVLYFHFNVDLI